VNSARTRSNRQKKRCCGLRSASRIPGERREGFLGLGPKYLRARWPGQLPLRAERRFPPCRTFSSNQAPLGLAAELTQRFHDPEHSQCVHNRGAIASQKFSEEFGNRAPKNIDNPDDPEVKWLSRGLLEACLAYINETKKGDALRVAAYEFTYPPTQRVESPDRQGIDVQIVYHDTSDATGAPNETAMKAAGLPINDQKITYRRSKTTIPHNKFIVRLEGGNDPVEVWTGSTSFTSSGFLGQTNVGHRVADAETARQYLAFWELVKKDPELKDARATLATLTPNPAEVIPVLLAVKPLCRESVRICYIAAMQSWRLCVGRCY
jgi:hypothetical protein